MGFIQVGKRYLYHAAWMSISFVFYFAYVSKYPPVLRRGYQVKKDVHGSRDQGSWCLGQVEQVSRSTNKTQCRVLDFIENLNRVSASDACDLEFSHLSTCNHVFYNAVPKSGSRLLRDLFTVLAQRYNYTNYDGADKMSMNPFRKGQAYLEQYMKKSQQNIPNFKRRHLFFLDFVRNVNTPLVMINVIREPIDHVISIYNWLAFGDKVRNRTKGDKQLTIGDCLKQYGDTGICIKWRLLPFPFFYGNQVHPDPETLQIAKQHVEDTYLLVGLTEDLDKFLETLELLLPHMFCNATAIYHEIESESKDRYKTNFKRNISEETREKLKYYLRYHIDFYDFVKQRFYNIVDKVTRQLACNNNNNNNNNDDGEDEKS